MTNKFEKGNDVEVTAKAENIFHDFNGVIVKVTSDGYIVQDQDENCFSVDEDQIELAS